jgi:glycerol-3-phosphate acyltransferase PlsY
MEIQSKDAPDYETARKLQMSHFLIMVCTVIFAFLWGGIPCGYIAVKLLKGEDIRKHGSGNIGATNARRVLGMRWFFGVLLLDALKGALPVLLTGMAPGFGGFERVIVAASTIGGSLFSPWLGFKGGKGIGISLGALLVLAPLPMLASLAAFVIALFALNYISIASLIAAIVFPAAIFAIESIRGIKHDAILLSFAILLVFALILMHRSNIARLANKTEPKFFNREK